MKINYAVVVILVTWISACTSSAQPAESPPSSVAPDISPTSVIPTATATLQPTPSPSPRPTIDLKLVLTPETTIDYEVDYFPLITSDNVSIMAKKYGQGEPAVILLHQGTLGANQRDWEPFARKLAERGFTAVSLDFRGRGYSKGDINQYNLIIRDVQALMDYLLETGYRRFICIGASMGGTSCMRTAVDYDLEGIGVIGSLMSNGEPTTISVEELAGLTIPKLFITTDNDVNPAVPTAIHDMYAISQEPKQVRVYPGTVHGTQMFNQPYGEEFTAVLMAFVESLR